MRIGKPVAPSEKNRLFGGAGGLFFPQEFSNARAIQQARDALGVPSSPSHSRNALLCQTHGHLPGRQSFSFEFGQHWRKLTCSLYSGCAVSGSQSFSPVAAEPNATSFRGLQRSARPARDHFALMFGNRCEDMKRQPRSMRIVHRDEFYARIHKSGDECQVA
jgi:hypothetical protein